MERREACFSIIFAFMHDLIASYLFQNKTCPLPGMGTLSILTSVAEANFTNRQISAPKPEIHFDKRETDTTGLQTYIAATTHSNTYEVTEALDHFFDDLRNEMTKQSTAKLDGVGNFFVDASGHIKFKEEELPPFFLPPVFAERVIHPKAEHHILVGDKETTNTIMAGFLDETPITKERWWIWAILLAAIGLLLLVIYFTQINGASPFGNAIKI